MFLGEIGGEIKFEGERLYKGEDIFIFLFGILNFEIFFGKLRKIVTSIYLYLKNRLFKLKLYLCN